MRPFDKSATSITIEVSLKEISEKGFDNIWDEIRSCYPVHQYEIIDISNKSSANLLFITLRIKRFIEESQSN